MKRAVRLLKVNKIHSLLSHIFEMSQFVFTALESSLYRNVHGIGVRIINSRLFRKLTMVTNNSTAMGIKTDYREVNLEKRKQFQPFHGV